MKILKKQIHLSLILVHTIILSSFQSTSSLDFVFNGFSNSSAISLYGDAAIESRVVSLTNKSSNSIGRALYKSKIQTKNPSTKSVLPFSVSFIFSIAPYEGILPGHGFVFLFVPFTGVEGSVASQHLGFLNFTNNGNSSNHILGIEFDVFKNQEFDDIDDNHVGVDLNSLKSSSSNTAGYWIDELKKEFKELKLNNGENYQVWIDYADSLINVTMAPVGEIRPKFPLLNVSLNLSDVFEEQMYVGFTASTGTLIEGHRILAWSFSNTNFSLSESLITTGLPSFVLPKTPFTQSTWFIAVMVVISLLVIVFFIVSALVFLKRRRKRAKERAEMEEWELEYWPHRMTYQEIETSTKGFAEENVIGVGGNGKVYKGVLPGGGIEIAVKRIPQENDEGMRAFLAEISSLGRLKHRNLVGLRGWCKKEKGNFMLVYDYMENGSLDKRVFDCPDDKLLTCHERITILKDVAEGVLYLHEGWESKVLHRDIKASNVLLDKDTKGRLGDFGLARIHLHNQVATTTRVVGTVGYLAPEVIKTGRASTQTDVFGFGVLILEVMCGRRPVEEGKPLLVEWVWEQMAQEQLVNALDSRLRVNAEGEALRFDEEEVERVLHLGLLCAYPDPSARPTMRQVVKVLEGKIEGHDTTTTSLDQGEDMETYLLQKVKSREMWSNYSLSFGYGSSHPTFDDIKQSNSSSMSVSWNNSIMEDGR